MFQESFDYTSGTTLGGNGTWTGTGSLITVGSSSLTYPGFSNVTPLGNDARVNGQAASVSEYSYTQFSPAVSSDTVYASFLLDFNGTVAGGNYTFMGLLPSAGNGGTFNNVNDPCDLVSRSSSGSPQLGIRTLGLGTTYASSTLSLGSVNVIVLKYDFTAHSASLFINPALDGIEPGAAAAVSQGTISASDVGQFYLRIGGVNQGNYLVDDVRIGTEWADVIPVPEPAAAALFGLGALGFYLARRMRR